MFSLRMNRIFVRSIDLFVERDEKDKKEEYLILTAISGTGADAKLIEGMIISESWQSDGFKAMENVWSPLRRRKSGQSERGAKQRQK